MLGEFRKFRTYIVILLCLFELFYGHESACVPFSRLEHDAVGSFTDLLYDVIPIHLQPKVRNWIYLLKL